jgi:rsbT co-antagonist protein RsbR
MNQEAFMEELERLRQQVADLEQQLAQARQQQQPSSLPYQAIFAQLPIPVNIFSLDGLLADMNIRNAEILNIPREAVVGTFNLLENAEAVKQGHGTFFQQALQGEVATMPPTAYDTASLHTEDDAPPKTVWTQTTYAPIRNEQGEIVCIVALNLDVTDRKVAEQALEANRTRLVDAQHLAHIGNWEWQSDTGKIIWSEEIYHLIGRSPEEVAPSYELFFEAIHPEDRAKVQATLQQAMETKTSYAISHRVVTPDEEVRFVKAHGEVMLDSDGTPRGMIGLVQDITDQTKAEEEIRQLNTRLKQRVAEQSEEQRRLVALIENSTDFIGISTLEGTALFVNKGGRTMLGIGNDQEIKNTALADYVPAQELHRYTEEIQPVLFAKGLWQGEFTYQHFQTGDPIPVYYTVFVINDLQTEQPLALGHVCRDLSQQKRAEEERLDMQERIIQAQRAALHELSTPLVPLSSEVIMLPLVGSIDSGRGQQIMETMLEGIAQHQATFAILDITGVPTIDTQVASLLVQTAQAARLLGATVILTGIGPTMAQTLVHLGADLTHIITRNTLQSGIAKTMELTYGTSEGRSSPTSS